MRPHIAEPLRSSHLISGSVSTQRPATGIRIRDPPVGSRGGCLVSPAGALPDGCQLLGHGDDSSRSQPISVAHSWRVALDPCVGVMRRPAQRTTARSRPLKINGPIGASVRSDA